MRKLNKTMILAVVLMALFANNAFVQATTTVNPNDLGDLGKQLEDAIKGLDNFDPNNPTANTTNNTQTQNNNKSTIETNMMIAAGDYYALGLKTDGTVVSTGLSLTGADAVSGWTNITMIACGQNHSVGLKVDGTVVAAGSYEEINDLDSWKDIKMIAAGLDFTLGLKKDGTVVASGADDFGRLDVQGWKNIVSISAGSNFSVGLKSDGTVLAIGKNCAGVLNVSAWKDIAAITSSYDNILGIKKDGTVIYTKKINTTGFKDCLSVTASAAYEAGLRKDGTVVNNSEGMDTSSWKNMIAISASPGHLVGLRSDGTCISIEANGLTALGKYDVSKWQLKVKKIATITATSSSFKTLVNNKNNTVEGYIFSSNPYLKIRDLAYLLMGTIKNFSVTGDGVKTSIKIVSKSAYKPLGTELKKGDGKPKTVTQSTSVISIDGKNISFSTYTINGETYFKLQDLLQKVNASVVWNATKLTITIDTSKVYK